jgi:magnesium chelatase family protein
MTQKVRSLGLSGIHGYEVSVECFLAGGLPNFDIVGLPDAAVREARERVRAAIKTCGYSFPLGRITVNLAPADTKKAGTVYDLPVMLGILAASDTIRPLSKKSAFIGELSLNGDVRPVTGALSMALAAERERIEELYVPSENALEAAFADKVRIFPVNHVLELIAHLEGKQPINPVPPQVFMPDYEGLKDFSEVKGQENVKHALEIAVAGGHNVLMSGPPGSGKSMLAGRIPSIFPDMSRQEALEATEIHSIVGETNSRKPIITQRPFRAPHHTISAVGLSGGGSNPKPGEISLAHNGVLFLDELPEFSRISLEILRQPMEEGEITISRASGSVTYPSRFMLICAMNPCRCGWYGHPSRRCKCSVGEVRAYRSRISGPLLDRIDIFVDVQSLEYDELRKDPVAEPSREVRKRVNAARNIQRQRYAGEPIECNAHMNARLISTYCRLDQTCEKIMKAAFDRLGLTARSHDKILRVSRTIADLEGSADIKAQHLTQALQYRSFDPRMDDY